MTGDGSTPLIHRITATIVCTLGASISLVSEAPRIAGIFLISWMIIYYFDSMAEGYRVGDR